MYLTELLQLLRNLVPKLPTRASPFDSIAGFVRQIPPIVEFKHVPELEQPSLEVAPITLATFIPL